MAVFITATVAILVTFMTRALKLSEFRQAWINGLCSGQLTLDTTLSFSSARAGANPSLN